MSPIPASERVVATSDAAETRALAARLAAVARPGDLLCLIGDLGAGKTQFAKGFAVGLGITDTVSSPTFVLMSEYAGRLPMFHVDLYRLDDAADALAGGLLDERQLDGRRARRVGGAAGPGAARRASRRRDRRHGRRAAPDRAPRRRRRLPALPRGGRVTGGRTRCWSSTRPPPRPSSRSARPDGALIASARGWPATATARSCWPGSRSCCATRGVERARAGRADRRHRARRVHRPAGRDRHGQGARLRARPAGRRRARPARRCSRRAARDGDRRDGRIALAAAGGSSRTAC